MDIHDEKLQPHISLERVKDIGLVRELVECFLCHGLLWYPVECQNCRKTFCLSCIQAWHTDKSQSICLLDCTTYIERRNPAIIIRLLTDLKISCRYQLNGCMEILSYNKLEEHEKRCDYQLLSCSGCKQGIIQKDFDEHQNECRLLLIKCDQCLTSFIRENKHLHTLTQCLCIQLQQHKSQIEQLQIKVANQQTMIDQMTPKPTQKDMLWETFFATVNDCNDLSKQHIE